MNPIGIGNRQSQQIFLRENEAFARESQNLKRLATKIFIRGLKVPSQIEVEELQSLPDDHPAVISSENRITAERIIFFLGRMTVDDFGEIITLSGNGFGFGAHKILRGMYECI